MHSYQYIHIVLWGACFAISIYLLNLRNPAVTLYEVDEDDEEGDEDEVHSVVCWQLSVGSLEESCRAKSACVAGGLSWLCLLISLHQTNYSLFEETEKKIPS